MTDYMGDWQRFPGMTNAPAMRWVSPQEDKVRGTGYFRLAYESSWAKSVSDLEMASVPDSWRAPAEKTWIMKLTTLEKSAALELYNTLTGIGTTSLPLTLKEDSDLKDTIPLGTQFGYSREKRAWVFKIDDDNYVLGAF